MTIELTQTRKYLETHRWLQYELDMRRASPILWILLGECSSKCKHIAGVPLKPSTAESLHQIFLAKGALATTAIEGNTLSEQEVLAHIEGKLQLSPSREYLGQEVDNIIAGCNDMLREIENGEPPALTSARVCELNRLVLSKLTLEPEVVPGEVRTHSVGVARYRGAPAEDCSYLLDRLCEWLDGPDFEPQFKEQAIIYAILKAIVAHVYIAWIHPFGDGNGRTARLIEFQILISSGVPAPAAHLLSNHYNQTRSEYYRYLDESSRSGGDLMPFLLYATRGLVDGLRAQLGIIRDQQWDVAWENFVHEKFHDGNTPSAERQKHLVLDLSRHRQPVLMQKLSQITPRVAAAYASKTKRTLTRDVNALSKLGLIVYTSNGLRANRERILAFLPITADSGE